MMSIRFWVWSAAGEGNPADADAWKKLRMSGCKSRERGDADMNTLAQLSLYKNTIYTCFEKQEKYIAAAQWQSPWVTFAVRNQEENTFAG